MILKNLANDRISPLMNENEGGELNPIIIGYQGGEEIANIHPKSAISLMKAYFKHCYKKAEG